jgi:hypothetical protein
MTCRGYRTDEGRFYFDARTGARARGDNGINGGIDMALVVVVTGLRLD